MTKNSDAWTYVKCLREDGIEMYIRDGKLFARSVVTDPGAIEYIKWHRSEIIAELKAEGEK